MKHSKRCGTKRDEHAKHIYVLDRVAIGGYLTQRRVTMLWDTCARCGTWLSLGPSDETPVVVEVRAADLAYGLAGFREQELYGWRSANLGLFPFPGEDAGYLEHAIAHHDNEQAAGQALSDDGTTEGA